MKKENLIIIIPYLSGGGAERAAIDLAINLKDKYNVKFVLFDSEKNKYDYDKNIELIDLKIKSTSSKIGKIVNIIKKIYKVYKVKKELNVKYSISFLVSPNFINALTKRKNEKVIISIRCKMSNQEITNIKNFQIKYASRKADKIVTLSEMVKNEQVNIYGANENKVKVIYNDCNVEKIKNKSNEKIQEKDILNILEKNKGKIVTNIGRLTLQKGQWHLIKAYKKVVEKIPNAKLIILGTGDIEQKLKKLVQKLKLEKNVFLLGFFSNPYKFLKKSDCFVFSSQFEGLGNSLLEAMACDQPIISTDCQYGPREILAPNSDFNYQTKKIEKADYGILIPTCSDDFNENDITLSKEEEIMADAIIMLLENDEERIKYSEKSKERIKFFSMDRNKNEWIKVLTED